MPKQIIKCKECKAEIVTSKKENIQCFKCKKRFDLDE